MKIIFASVKRSGNENALSIFTHIGDEGSKIEAMTEYVEEIGLSDPKFWSFAAYYYLKKGRLLFTILY